MEQRFGRMISMEGYGIETINRVNEIQFDREFTAEQREWVEKAIAAPGMPLRNVRQVSYLGNDADGKEQWLGHWQQYESQEGNLVYKGEVALYKNLEKVPAIGVLGTIVHEEAHANTPLYEGNFDLYGGRENMRRARQHAEVVAKRTIATHVYLNPYHAYLYKEFAEGRMDPGTFVEETHAIMTELAFTNREHLKQVSDAQAFKLGELSKDGKVKPKVDILEGAEKTLIDLLSNGGALRDIKTTDDLEEYIDKVRAGFKAGLVQSPTETIQFPNVRRVAKAA